jgi:hypothetical protein
MCELRRGTISPTTGAANVTHAKTFRNRLHSVRPRDFHCPLRMLPLPHLYSYASRLRASSYQAPPANNLTNIDNTDTVSQQEQRPQPTLRQLLAIWTTNLSTMHENRKRLKICLQWFLNFERLITSDYCFGTQRASRRKNDLQELLKRERRGICAFSETQLFPSVPINICNFATYR